MPVVSAWAARYGCQFWALRTGFLWPLDTKPAGDTILPGPLVDRYCYVRLRFRFCVRGCISQVYL